MMTKAVGQMLGKENDAIKEIIQRERKLLLSVAKSINWLNNPKAANNVPVVFKNRKNLYKGITDKYARKIRSIFT